MNKELGKLSCWINKKCIKCGRTPKETILNIEGFIHHNIKLECLNKKECQKYRKKK